MMKSRLAASIHFLSAGKCWGNTRSTVSSRSIFAIFDRRHGQIERRFHGRGFDSSNRTIHSSALEDEDEFSQKMDDIGDDDDVFSELDTEISESSPKEIQLVSKKPAFSDDTFSELGPGTSECSAKQLKLVTEKRDNFSNTHFHRTESTNSTVSSDYGTNRKTNTKELMDILRSSSHSSIKSHAPILEPIYTDNKESDSKSPSSVYKPNINKLFGTITKAPKTSSTSFRSTNHAPTSSDNTRKISKTTKATTTSSTKLHSTDHTPTSSDDTRKIVGTKYPLSVSVKNIPSEVGLPAVIEAISVYGKVSGASFVASSDKLKSCNIEFEDADSCRRATLAGSIEVGCRILVVTSLDTVELVAVRINNINETTADSVVHSICKSAGELVGLTRTSKNYADAFFNVQNHTSPLDIVKKLNNTVFDLNHWSACMLTSIPNSTAVPDRSRIFDRFSDLKTELGMASVYLQDLEYLNVCLVHIQDSEPTPNQSI